MVFELAFHRSQGWPAAGDAGGGPDLGSLGVVALGPVVSGSSTEEKASSFRKFLFTDSRKMCQNTDTFKPVRPKNDRLEGTPEFPKTKLSGLKALPTAEAVTTSGGKKDWIELRNAG